MKKHRKKPLLKYWNEYYESRDSITQSSFIYRASRRENYSSISNTALQINLVSSKYKHSSFTFFIISYMHCLSVKAPPGYHIEVQLEEKSLKIPYFLTHFSYLGMVLNNLVMCLWNALILVRIHVLLCAWKNIAPTLVCFLFHVKVTH